MALIDKVKGAPVDRTAALVTSKRRGKYDDTAHIPQTRWHSEVPPPMRHPDPGMRPGTNLTGRRFGWLTVVGQLDYKAADRDSGKRRRHGAHWVVRCDCGKYETRFRKGLTNPKNKEDRCAACWKLARMKRHRDYLDGRPQKEVWEY
jgi:hypothetical protein